MISVRSLCLSTLLLLAYLDEPTLTMAVTIRPASHAPRKWEGSLVANSPESLFSEACPSEHRRCKRIIQSSLTIIADSISPSTNGFVHAAVEAYSGHHHLILRPEDVWFAILTQLGFFINANAEEVRSFFVSHQGRKELEVTDFGNIHTADFGSMARRMTELIAKNVVDPELRTWIMPAFSTTTESDKVVASILMMGAMQKYFSYSFSLVCGIPSVTLLGVRSDWELMLNRLEMLPRLGSEPAQFYGLLKPVLRFFVKSFDSPTDPTVLNFWSKIAHQSGGSGPYYLSGWITAFCFWKPNGKLLYAPPKGRIEIEGFGHRNPGCELDGTLYHRVNTDDIPDGQAAVPVTVDDDGRIYKTRMVAGSVGIRVTSSGDILDIGRGQNDRHTFTRGPDGSLIPYVMEAEPGHVSGPDSLQPVSGWWMYELLEGFEDGYGQCDEVAERYARRFEDNRGEDDEEFEGFEDDEEFEGCEDDSSECEDHTRG